MNNTQSIIVYRNPAEAHFWESGLAFPLMAAMIVAVGAAIITGKIVGNYHKYAGHAVAIAATVSAIATFWFLT